MTGRLLIHSGVRCAFNVEKKKMKGPLEGMAAYVTCDTRRQGKWRAFRAALTRTLSAQREGTKS